MRPLGRLRSRLDVPRSKLGMMSRWESETLPCPASRHDGRKRLLCVEHPTSGKNVRVEPSLLPGCRGVCRLFTVQSGKVAKWQVPTGGLAPRSTEICVSVAAAASRSPSHFGNKFVPGAASFDEKRERQGTDDRFRQKPGPPKPCCPFRA